MKLFRIDVKNLEYEFHILFVNAQSQKDAIDYARNHSELPSELKNAPMEAEELPSTLGVVSYIWNVE